MYVCMYIACTMQNDTCIYVHIHISTCSKNNKEHTYWLYRHNIFSDCFVIYTPTFTTSSKESRQRVDTLWSMYILSQPCTVLCQHWSWCIGDSLLLCNYVLFPGERQRYLLGGEKGDLYSCDCNNLQKSFIHLFYILRNTQGTHRAY